MVSADFLSGAHRETTPRRPRDWASSLRGHAADKAPKRAAKVSTADFTKDGEPNVHPRARWSSIRHRPDPVREERGPGHAHRFHHQAHDRDGRARLASLRWRRRSSSRPRTSTCLKNTKSRLPIGAHFRRDDLLRLALMASDNRAAPRWDATIRAASPRSSRDERQGAGTLGLTQTHYVDSSGLSPANVSSPQDLARLVAAAAKYPLISEYSPRGPST
jgi:hypothetical protein